jgi:hypothetical protein
VARCAVTCVQGRAGWAAAVQARAVTCCDLQEGKHLIDRLSCWLAIKAVAWWLQSVGEAVCWLSDNHTIIVWQLWWVRQSWGGLLCAQIVYYFRTGLCG